MAGNAEDILRPVLDDLEAARIDDANIVDGGIDITRAMARLEEALALTAHDPAVRDLHEGMKEVFLRFYTQGVRDKTGVTYCVRQWQDTLARGERLPDYAVEVAVNMLASAIDASDTTPPGAPRDRAIVKALHLSGRQAALPKQLVELMRVFNAHYANRQLADPMVMALAAVDEVYDQDTLERLVKKYAHRALVALILDCDDIDERRYYEKLLKEYPSPQ